MSKFGAGRGSDTEGAAARNSRPSLCDTDVAAGTTPPGSLNAAPEATLRTLLADAHDLGERCQLHELHHYGRATDALDALVAERDRYRAALQDEIAMAEQSVGKLVDVIRGGRRVTKPVTCRDDVAAGTTQIGVSS